MTCRHPKTAQWNVADDGKRWCSVCGALLLLLTDSYGRFYARREWFKPRKPAPPRAKRRRR